MRRTLALTFAAVMPFFILSCSSGGSGPDEAGTGVIVDQNIEDGDTGISLAAAPSVEFRDPMDAATIDESTFFVQARDVDGSVEYDGSSRTATFIPDALYEENTWYELVISGDIENTDGQALGTDRTISFMTGDLDCDGLADRMEPNEDWSDPSIVDVDRWYRTLTLCEDDRDVYSFTIDDTATVTINARAEHSPGTEWLLAFRTSEGVNYRTNYNTPASGETARIHYTFLPGTYNVVIGSNLDATYYLYDLMIETSEPYPDDQYEDNDFIEDAAHIAPGHYDGLLANLFDFDWYSFDAISGDSISVAVHVDELAGSPHWTFDIYNPEGGHVGGGIVNEPDHTVSVVATMTGSYYARLWYPSDGVRYSMDIEVGR